MYNALSNFPASRAFVTQPFIASVEFSPQEVDKMTRIFSRDQLRTADVTTGTVDQSIRISDVKFYYPDEETFWIFERLNSGFSNG